MARAAAVVIGCLLGASVSAAKGHTRRAGADAGTAAEGSCAESAQELSLSATAPQIDELLALMAKGLSGQKFTSDDGTTFTVTKVHDLSWRGGVEGKADVDFDHAAASGTGVLPVRVEVTLDEPAQRLMPHVRLTGPIRILKSRPKGEGLGFLAEGGGRLVEALSETEAFRDEFSRRAEASLVPPTISELVRTVAPKLTQGSQLCVASAHLDSWSPSLDGLSLKGRVSLKGPGAHCCAR